ncbi:MAG: DUF302 domain-containing protein [Thermodesulfobacteriota bacterium]
MRQLVLSIIALFFLSSMAVADSGLVTVKSSHTVKETADRLENVLQKKGMTLFDRIDHAAGARKVGKELRPTELLIFGNPKVGTPLMQCGQTMAIDLPQKALIWEDAGGQVWFSYNEPEYMARRHNSTGCLEVIKKVEGVLANFAAAATAP